MWWKQTKKKLVSLEAQLVTVVMNGWITTVGSKSLLNPLVCCCG